MDSDKIAKLEQRIERLEIDAAYDLLRSGAEHLATLALLKSLTESSGLVGQWSSLARSHLRDSLMQVEDENPDLAVKLKNVHPGLWDNLDEIDFP